MRQPYDRRAELVEVAVEVPNLSAKHEGGDPDVEATREHPSDLLDYFLPKDKVIADGLMPLLQQNYLDKHAAVNHTAAELTRAGIGVKAAALQHGVVAAPETVDTALDAGRWRRCLTPETASRPDHRATEQ